MKRCFFILLIFCSAKSAYAGEVGPTSSGTSTISVTIPAFSSWKTQPQSLNTNPILVYTNLAMPYLVEVRESATDKSGASKHELLSPEEFRKQRLARNSVLVLVPQ